MKNNEADNSQVGELQVTHRAELRIGTFLRVGVAFVAILLGCGWCGMLLQRGHMLGGFATYSARPLQSEIQLALARHDIAQLAVWLGLAALVALPILRVLFTVMLFLKLREGRMASLALFVFVVLVVSVFLGLDI